MAGFNTLLPKITNTSILGVEYTCLKTEDGSDLLLTRFGLPFKEQLAPRNWYEPTWFAQHRIRLEGTSTIYKVSTRPVAGLSLDLVVRFSRVGQEIPLPSSILGENADAEFNSPFEEFGLLMELRKAAAGNPGRMFTKRPLAIYVPAARFQEWQTGRLESKMAAKQARHPDVLLHMYRQYIVLYGWIKGLNAVQAARTLSITRSDSDNFLREAPLRARTDLQRCGFRVLDIKPEHVVMRIYHDGTLLLRRSGAPAYALVDYELLQHI